MKRFFVYSGLFLMLSLAWSGCTRQDEKAAEFWFWLLSLGSIAWLAGLIMSIVYLSTGSKKPASDAVRACSWIFSIFAALAAISPFLFALGAQRDGIQALSIILLPVAVFGIIPLIMTIIAEGTESSKLKRLKAQQQELKDLL